MCLPILLMTSCNKKEDSIVEDTKEYEQSVLQERIDSGYFDNPSTNNVDFEKLNVILAFDTNFRKYRPSDFPDIELKDIKESFHFSTKSSKNNKRRNLVFVFNDSSSTNDYIIKTTKLLLKYKFVYDATYYMYLVGD